VAEISAAFACAALGIYPTVRHADYIGSWLEVLREDNRAIVRAASQASKATDWLLSRLPENVDIPIAAYADAALAGKSIPRVSEVREPLLVGCGGRDPGEREGEI
jgi:antirestriction protein ArdC